MAKTNKQAIIRYCKDIEKKEGEGAVYSLGSPKAALKIPRWSTGIEDLDYIIGGGMPEGRVVEISGPESSGKTSLLYHLLAQHEISLDIPIEGTFDGQRAKMFGNRPKQLLIYRARYGEQAFNKMMKFGEAGIPLIGVDSVPSMQPKEDIDKIKKMADNEKIEEFRIGGIARLMTNRLPALEEIIEVSGTTVIFINQVRDKFNAPMFGEKTDTPGGRKLKFSSSIRIQVARRAWIEIPNKDPRISSENKKIGLIMKLKVIKSKVCDPYGECEIPLIFDRGFVSFDDVHSIRQELMKKNKVKKARDEEDDE